MSRGALASLVALTVAAVVLTAGIIAGSAFAGGDIWIQVPETHRIPDKGHGRVQMTAKSTPGEIADMFVGVHIKHPQTRDLKLWVRDDEGEKAVLTNRDTKGPDFGEPGEGCSVNMTYFRGSGDPLASGTAPYADTFLPIQSLDRFDGENAKGKWTLTVKDLKKGNRGKIKCFVISFYLAH